MNHQLLDKQLAQLSNHVLFEFQQLQQTGIRIENGNVDAATRNALVYSFTIHARNLLHFFYPSSPKPKDVLAADFCKAWPQTRPKISTFLKTQRERICKEIAHITTERLKLGTTAIWPCGRIMNELRAIFFQFKNLVPREKSSNEFSNFRENTGSDITPSAMAARGRDSRRIAAG